VRGAWQRYVYCGKGDWATQAESHPLSWFTQDPFLRDDGNDFCAACTAQEKATVHLKRKARSEVRRIGALRGFGIYDVYYFFDGEERIRWKSILVRTKAGMYREIYHLQPPEANIKPSFLLKISEVELLGTNDEIPGSGAFRFEAYFGFSDDGPTRIDFSPLREAVSSLLPPGGVIRKGFGFDLKSLSYQSPVWRQDDSNGHPTGGKVSVRFRMEGSRVVVTDRRFDPPPSQ
jgi:hypothetical protein